MKRILSIILCLTLLLLMFGCSKEKTVSKKESGQSIQETHKSEEKELTIIMPYCNSDIEKTYRKCIGLISGKLLTEKGIRINIEKLEASNYDEYVKKRNTRLYLEEGPTLITINVGEGYKELVDQSVALDVSEKIPNLKNLYNNLSDGYYIPITMLASVIPLKGDVLEKLGIPKPGLDWTKDDFYKIRDTWLEKETVYFNRSEFFDLLNKDIMDVEIYNEETESYYLNTKEFKEFLENVRNEIHSGKYILDEAYTYENYYNMVFELESEEFKESIALCEANAKVHFQSDWWAGSVNPFNTLESSVKFNSNTLVLPSVLDPVVTTWGFIINKNGKNIETGLEFLNEFLSDEVQFELYKNKKASLINGAVVKTIEEDIKEIEEKNSVAKEAKELRRYVLEQFEKGVYKLNNNHVSKNRNIGVQLFKVIVKIVFADEPYTDEEISQMLQALENELNLFINE